MEKKDFNKRIKHLFFRFLKEENLYTRFIHNYYNCRFDSAIRELFDKDDPIYGVKTWFSAIGYIEKMIGCCNSEHIFFDAFQWDKDPNINWGLISAEWGNLFISYANLEHRRKEMILI